MKLMFFIICIFCGSLRAGELVFDKMSDLPIHQDIQDTLEQAYASIGYQLNYKTLPLKRSYREAEIGRLSGLMGRVYTAEQNHENLLRVPIALASFKIALVVNSNLCHDCDITNIPKVASVSGFEALRHYIEQHDVVFDLMEVSDRDTLYRMMSKKRITAMLVSDVLLPNELLQANPHWRVSTIAEENLYHYLNKENEHIIPKLTLAIQNVLTEKQSAKNDAAVSSLDQNSH